MQTFFSHYEPNPENSTECSEMPFPSNYARPLQPSYNHSGVSSRVIVLEKKLAMREAECATLWRDYEELLQRVDAHAPTPRSQDSWGTSFEQEQTVRALE